ncbi:MAG: hypothetical protein IPH08_03980 [Rhodocyclaceae bacterium]|nr:hypothetical protein [Rhodocyclaceae bacterium]
MKVKFNWTDDAVAGLHQGRALALSVGCPFGEWRFRARVWQYADDGVRATMDWTVAGVDDMDYTDIEIAALFIENEALARLRSMAHEMGFRLVPLEE